MRCAPDTCATSQVGRLAPALYQKARFGEERACRSGGQVAALESPAGCPDEFDIVGIQPLDLHPEPLPCRSAYPASLGNPTVRLCAAGGNGPSSSDAEMPPQRR